MLTGLGSGRQGTARAARLTRPRLRVKASFTTFRATIRARALTAPCGSTKLRSTVTRPSKISRPTSETTPSEADSELALDAADPVEGEADDAASAESSDGPDLDDVVLAPMAAAEVPALGAASDAQEALGVGPGNLLSEDELVRAVATLVFASPEPITIRRLLEILERPERARLDAALILVRERLASTGLPLELREIAGGFHILSKPEMGEIVQRLFKARKAERISAAALETLAVVAYRQPVSKAEIEAIRGVQAGPILRTLIERGLVRVTGRADVPGHPLHYGTTRDFLDRFGLGSLDELPRDAELTKD